MKLEQKQVNPYAPPEASSDPEFEPDLELLDALGAPSLGRRFLAAMLDNVIITAISWVPIFVVMGFEASPELLQLTNVTLSLGLRVVYYGVMESSPMQATLGKRALGLVVVDQRAQRLSTGRAFGRALSRSLLLLLSLPALWVAIDKRGRGIWDHIAGTRVVERFQLDLLVD